MPVKAFLFPGQGSQSLGMLDHYPAYQEIVLETLKEASDALGYSMTEVIGGQGVQHDDAVRRLNQTEYTQPALLTTSIALWRILVSLGHSCDYVAGHSLGEYSALVAAEGLDFAEALRLVRLRGQLMQRALAGGQGKMAAVIDADVAALNRVCAEISTDDALVQLANYNSPRQTVVSGNAQAIDALLDRLKETSARRAVVLPVEVPSHCALMQPAEKGLAQALKEIRLKPLLVPILPNIDPQPTKDPQKIVSGLIAQISSPVRWYQTIEELINRQVSMFVECGPGKVLSGLNNQISRDHPCQPTLDQASIETLQRSVASQKPSDAD